MVKIATSVGGHYYLDLAEKVNGNVIAKITGFSYGDRFEFIRTKFKRVTNEELSNGMKVLLRVNVSYHALYGLKLMVLDIEPRFTLGEMLLTRQRTIERLRAEDSFNRNKLLSLPLLPRRIAIISSETNAGYRDFLTKINARKEYVFIHQLFSSHIDGDVAIQEIIEQLNQIRKQIDDFDIVTIIRGGDNAIGLHCYDSYELAKAVALFPIPVVTGISHSTSNTVVEMVAKASNITPTDLAVFIIALYESFEDRITVAKRKIQSSLQQRLRQENERFLRNKKLFTSRAKRIIDVKKVELKSARVNFIKSATSFFVGERNNLAAKSSSLKYKPVELVRTKKSELHSLLLQLKKSVKTLIKDEKAKIEGLEKEVKHKSPETILSRGYSITFHDGRPVKDASKVKDGARLRTQVHKGEIISHVTNEKP